MRDMVTWSRTTNFTGRNGGCKCSGVELLSLEHNKSVMVSALTGRGDVGRCDIEIPLEALPDLIAKLELIRRHADRTTGTAKPFVRA
jgi:hypothetical protein